MLCLYLGHLLHMEMHSRTAVCPKHKPPFPAFPKCFLMPVTSADYQKMNFMSVRKGHFLPFFGDSFFPPQRWLEHPILGYHTLLFGQHPCMKLPECKVCLSLHCNSRLAIIEGALSHPNSPMKEGPPHCDTSLAALGARDAPEFSA